MLNNQKLTDGEETFYLLFPGQVKRESFSPILLNGAITSGASMTSLDREIKAASSSYVVSAALEIENFSQWPLISPQVYPIDGQISYPPSPVLPGQRQAMVMHKTPYSVFGTHGTVSWELNGEKRIIVMWSMPWHFIFEKNKLALGLINRDLHFDTLAEDMKNDPIHYTVGEYYYSTNPIKHCDDAICVQGTMSTSHHSMIKISVYPKRKSDLAQNVQDYMNKYDLSTVIG